MTKILFFVKTLFYYDDPQVIELRDQDGDVFIATMVESTSKKDMYLTAKTSKNVICNFCSGNIDLRSIMLHSDEWYTFESDDLKTLIEAKECIKSDRLKQQLPLDGFFI